MAAGRKEPWQPPGNRSDSCMRRSWPGGRREAGRMLVNVNTWRRNVMRLWFALAAGSVIVAPVGSEVRVSAEQGPQPAPPAFTAEQASLGKVAYSRTCARCHMPDLGGTPDA